MTAAERRAAGLSRSQSAGHRTTVGLITEGAGRGRLSQASQVAYRDTSEVRRVTVASNYKFEGVPTPSAGYVPVGHASLSSGCSTVNSWNPSFKQEFAADEEREWPEVDFEDLEDSSQPHDKSTDTETVGPQPLLSLAEVERQLPASPDEARHNSPTEASEEHSVLTSTLSPSLFKFNSPDFVPLPDFFVVIFVAC
jgi:hypothetical protein